MRAKQIAMVVCTGLALAAAAFAPAVHARGGYDTPALRVIGEAPVAERAGKSREQAREALLEAWCDGTLQHDASDVNYPYSPESIERLRTLRAGKPIPGVAARCQ